VWALWGPSEKKEEGDEKAKRRKGNEKRKGDEA